MESKAKWYVLHTFSGYENVAKENLKLVIENFNLHDRVFDIVIPTQDVIEENAKGKKVVVNKKILPSYIFIKMDYGDDIWHAITRTRGVTGFAGPKGRPLPLTDEEIQKMHLEKIVYAVNVGDKVELMNGALEGQVGVVTNVDEENKKITVKAELFGQDQDVEVDFGDYKPLEEDKSHKFAVGDKIEIINGAMKGQMGVINSINDVNRTVNASVSGFGKEMDAEIAFADFKKVDDISY